MDVNNQLKMVLIGIDPSTYKLKKPETNRYNGFSQYRSIEERIK